MAQHAFLSPAWIDAARTIRQDHPAATPQVVLRMNLVVEEVPFGDGRLEAFVNTSAGELELELGQLEGPDVTVSLDYTTARSVLVDGDGQAAMAAFMAGKVRVEGDITKLLAYQGSPPDAAQRELYGALQAITEQ